MKTSLKGGSTLRFGQFELILFDQRLLKKGLPVRLENQPLQILAALLDRPGELVTREELSSRLWPDGTYVDFDEGLNTAIKKLRYALGDSAESPVFIETTPKRGYRFIAPVQADAEATELPGTLSPGEAAEAAEVSPESHVVTPSNSKLRWTAARVLGLGLAVATACALFYRVVFPPALRVTQVTRLTNSGRTDPWGRLASDGSRLFYLDRDGDHWNNRQISTAGGESMPFGPTGRNMRVLAVSPDQSEILFSPFSSRIPNLPLWSMPLVGGAPRRVGDILASGATFSPDGSQIAFANSKGVFLTNVQGSNVRQLAAVPGCWDIVWSPDGKLLRFTQEGPHSWQVAPNGGDLRPFLPTWNAGQGRWTADGAYYIFASPRERQSTLKGGPIALWALRESSLLPWPSTPKELAITPLSMDGPLPSRDGHTVFAFGGVSQQIDVVRFDPTSHRFKPVLPGFNATEIEFSPDRQWMLYSNWNQLWRSRPDGSDPLQLAGSPSIPHNYFARWSPDSKHILFEDVEDDKGAVYLVSAEGGAVQEPLGPGRSRHYPSWSADGRSIVYWSQGEAGEGAGSKPGIYAFDLATGHSTFVAGSGGFDEAYGSPDGRFFVARTEDQSVIKFLDIRTRRWREVARGTLIAYAGWSADSVLYFQDILAPGEPVYRYQPGGAAPQRVYSFEDILQSGAQRCAFQGFAPDGSLLVQVNRGGGDVFALTLSQP